MNNDSSDPLRNSEWPTRCDTACFHIFFLHSHSIKVSFVYLEINVNWFKWFKWEKSMILANWVLKMRLSSWKCVCVCLLFPLIKLTVIYILIKICTESMCVNYKYTPMHFSNFEIFGPPMVHCLLSPNSPLSFRWPPVSVKARLLCKSSLTTARVYFLVRLSRLSRIIWLHHAFLLMY